MKRILSLLVFALFMISTGPVFSYSSGTASQILTYEAPKDWVKETPSSSMRKDQYRLPGKAGDATLTVFHFPGTGGSVEANLQRWYAQFEDAKGAAVTKPEKKSDTKIGDLPVTTVFLTGTYNESKSPMMMGGPVEKMKNYALWGAIVETKDSPWFFKVTGPKETVEKWMKSLEEFTKTFSVKK